MIVYIKINKVLKALHFKKILDFPDQTECFPHYHEITGLISLHLTEQILSGYTSWVILPTQNYPSILFA